LRDGIQPAVTGWRCHLWLAGDFIGAAPQATLISHDKHDKQHKNAVKNIKESVKKPLKEL